VDRNDVQCSELQTRSYSGGSTLDQGPGVQLRHQFGMMQQIILSAFVTMNNITLLPIRRSKSACSVLWATVGLTDMMHDEIFTLKVSKLMGNRDGQTRRPRGLCSIAQLHSQFWRTGSAMHWREVRPTDPHSTHTQYRLAVAANVELECDINTPRLVELEAPSPLLQQIHNKSSDL